MGDLPYAKYANGTIFWRGTDPDYWARSLPAAIAQAEDFERAAAKGDAGVPGWSDRCKAFAADLRKAITEYEADNAD